MNKYIRTKDNKIVKVDVENGIYTSKYELVGEPKNTIEELLDGIIIVANDGTILFYNIPDWLDLKQKILENKAWISFQGLLLNNNDKFKGNLINLKVNEKGELKLI